VADDRGGRPERAFWWAVPVLALSWATVLTWQWLRLDKAFFFWDPGAHMLSAADFLADPWRFLTQVEQRYPPLGQVLLGLTYRSTGYDLPLTLALYNLSFLALLLAAVYDIGRTLYSPRVAAMATALLVVYPEVVIRLRFPLLDIPLVALTAAALAALLRSRRFESRGFTVAFGTLVGLAQLMKHLGVLLALPPALFVLWQAARPFFRGRPLREAAPIAANLGLASVAAALLALPWWLPRWTYYTQEWVPAQARFSATYADAGLIGTFSVASLAYYSLGLWYVASFGLTLLWWLTLRSFLKLPERSFTLVWWVSTYALLTVIPTKETRYAVLLLPAVALMTAGGLDRFRFARTAFVATIAFGVVQAWAISFGVRWLPEGRQVHAVNLAEPIQPFSQHYHLEMGFWPDPQGWGLASELARLRGRIAVVDPAPEPPPYRSLFLVEGLQLQHLEARSKGDRSTVVELASCEAPDELRGFDYLLQPVGREGSPFEPTAYAARCATGFTEVARVPVIRPPGRDPEDFFGMSHVAVFRIDPGATLVRSMGRSHPLPADARLEIVRSEALSLADRVERVVVTIANRSGATRAGRVFYVVARPDADAWRSHGFASAPQTFRLGPRSALELELPGSPAQAPGQHLVVIALHETPDGAPEPGPGHSSVVPVFSEPAR
jgi:hypothetical protein